MTDNELMQARLEIAGFLKQKRIKLGYTQQYLAERMGTTWETISRLERGVFWPRVPQLLKWCNCLQIDLLKIIQDASA